MSSNGAAPLSKLLIKTEFTKEQAAVVGWIMDHAGVCVGCDLPLKANDVKFPLGILPPPVVLQQKIPSHFAVAAYCYGCAMKINGLLKDLNRLAGRMKLKINPDIEGERRGYA